MLSSAILSCPDKFPKVVLLLFLSRLQGRYFDCFQVHRSKTIFDLVVRLFFIFTTTRLGVARSFNSVVARGSFIFLGVNSITPFSSLYSLSSRGNECVVCKSATNDYCLTTEAFKVRRMRDSVYACVLLTNISSKSVLKRQNVARSFIIRVLCN